MPFLRDEGPPIPQASIQKYRESLPLDYGWQVVNETGREVLVVRVPKAKPDYLHDLSEVAFYVGLDTIRNTKDVLLVGHEKTARLEPQLLRDHIRAQAREDQGVVDGLRRSLDRQYGHTFVQSPSNFQHRAFAVRIPKETVAQFSPEDVAAIRDVVTNLKARVGECQYAYVLANADHERLGKRVLFELVGMTEAPAAPAAAPELPVVAPPAPPAPAAPAPVAARTRFPATPGSAPVPAAAAPAPAPAPAPVAAAPAPAPVPAPIAAAEVADHEEYTIVSKPKAKAEAPPAPRPAPAAGLADATHVHEEYEIVSKPKAPAAPAPPAPAPAAHHGALEGADVVEKEYEVVSKPKAPAAPAPVAEEADAAPQKTVLHADKEFEVFASKPKPRAQEKPSITPPGMGGFAAAIAGATSNAGHAPTKTKEYEIQGRTSVVSDATIASRLKLPSATPGAAPPAAPSGLPFAAAAAPTPPPAMAPASAALPHLHFPSAAPAQAPPPAPAAAAAPPALPTIHFAPPPAPEPEPMAAPAAAVPPRVAALPLPAADSGTTIIPKVTAAAPELVLAQKFRESGYEVVEGLRAQGTVFAFAAHKPNGRRVLVKRAPDFGPEDASALAGLVAALGADVALVVADAVKPGTRLATWGTRIEVITPVDAGAITF